MRCLAGSSEEEVSGRVWPLAASDELTDTVASHVDSCLVNDIPSAFRAIVPIPVRSLSVLSAPWTCMEVTLISYPERSGVSRGSYDLI